MRALRISFAVSFAAIASGCGSGGDSVDAALPDLATPLDLTAPADLTFVPHLPPMQNHGGPVLASIELWTVVYPGDEALGADLDAFHRDLFATGYYWSGILGQYGVTGGTAKGTIVLPTPKPAMLQHDAIPGLLDTAAAGLGAAKNANTALILVVPKSTQIVGATAGYAGYHNESAGGLPFAVVTQVDTMHGTAFQNLTFISSHEVSEVATDPFLNSRPAWLRDDLGKSGEVADLCNPLDAFIYAIGDGGMPMQGGYLVARLWNNDAAAGGKVDPCWHYPKGVPYFAVAVDPLVAPSGAGASLHVFSYGDVGVVDWEIDGLPPGVTVTPAQGANQAGDVIPIAIDPAGLTADFPLVVFGTSEKTTYNSVWWFTVHPQ